MSSHKKEKKETAFIPIGPGGPGGNFPGGTFPGGNFPGGNFPGNQPNLPGNQPNFPGNQPNFPGNQPNFPGNQPNFPTQPGQAFPGSANQPPFNNNNLNIGNPPNITPSKNDPGVKLFNTNNKNNPKAVSPSSISFCLYKFTFIWEHRGKSYWTFLLSVNRTNISGLRWVNRRWVFFGLDLRRIDAFICYRNSDSCTNSANPFEFRTEYTKKGQRNIYLRTLTSVDIPEIKEDVIFNSTTDNKGEDVTVSYPCKKSRNNTYRIVLQLTYPVEFNKGTSEILNGAALAACEEAGKSLCVFRDTNDVFTSLDLFDEATNNIPSAFDVFNKEFTQAMRRSKLSADLLKEVEYSIVKEKLTKDWNLI